MSFTFPPNNFFNNLPHSKLSNTEIIDSYIKYRKKVAKKNSPLDNINIINNKTKNNLSSQTYISKSFLRPKSVYSSSKLRTNHYKSSQINKINNNNPIIIQPKEEKETKNSKTNFDLKKKLFNINNDLFDKINKKNYNDKNKNFNDIYDFKLDNLNIKLDELCPSSKNRISKSFNYNKNIDKLLKKEKRNQNNIFKIKNIDKIGDKDLNKKRNKSFNSTRIENIFNKDKEKKVWTIGTTVKVYEYRNLFNNECNLKFL